MNVVEAQSSERTAELFATITALVPELAQDAASSDSAGCFPFTSVATLRDAGMLMAPVPVEFGGFGLHGKGDSASLFQLLHLVGYADLSLGRIFEAHVNAFELIQNYGTPRQLEAAALAAQGGDLFALWVTDPANHAACLSRDFTLTGEKWFCSAAGEAKQALIDAPERSLGAGEPVAATSDAILWARPAEARQGANARSELPAGILRDGPLPGFRRQA